MECFWQTKFGLFETTCFFQRTSMWFWILLCFFFFFRRFVLIQCLFFNASFSTFAVRFVFPICVSIFSKTVHIYIYIYIQMHMHICTCSIIHMYMHIYISTSLNLDNIYALTFAALLWSHTLISPKIAVHFWFYWWPNQELLHKKRSLISFMIYETNNHCDWSGQHVAPSVFFYFEWSNGLTHTWWWPALSQQKHR